MSSLKTLIIVESPAKAKTIQKYLGPDYIVRASFGHVRDLDSKKLSIDVENNFQPTYVTLPQRKKQIDDIRSILSQSPSPNVILATDEDREGEAIAWHLCHVLRLPLNTPRMVFHEITPAALLYAVEHARTIDMNLVNSQQARRLIDRLVGFKISPLLWKNIQSKLSAGRVQSVALQFIIDREKEIDHFMSSDKKSHFSVNASFLLPNNNSSIIASFYHSLELSTDVSPLFLNCVESVFTVANIQNSQKSITPPPPFITSSLQQDVYNKYHISAKQTMSIAQKLYESGHITYHRTDSFHISRDIQNQIISWIQSNYGDNYVHLRNFNNKSTSAQEAHECIRPTKIDVSIIPDLAPTELKVYQLIWKRTIASQMANALYDLRNIQINGSNLDLKKKEFFIAKFSKIAFDGFLRVYHLSNKENSNSDADSDSDLPTNSAFPSFSLNTVLRLNRLVSEERFPLPPVRYTDASLVKLLEEAEIGRPSTYATILTTIQDREYVIKKTVEGRKVTQKIFELDLNNQSQSEIIQKMAEFSYPADNNRFFSTETGRLVHQFIQDHCMAIIHPDFTKNMEKQLDDVTNGSVQWNSILDNFYPQLLSICSSSNYSSLNTPKTPLPTPIPETLPSASSTTQKLSALNQKTKKSLGIHPLTSKPIFVYRGKFGPVAQMGDKPNPIFVKLPSSLSITTCSLEDVIPLFDYPKILGQLDEKDITLKKGQYGIYLQWNDKNYSIRNIPEDEINIDRAISIIQNPPNAAATANSTMNKNCIRKISDSISILNGKFGNYIQILNQGGSSGKPTNIPFKQYNDSMSNEDILAFIENSSNTNTNTNTNTKKRSVINTKTKSVRFSSPISN